MLLNELNIDFDLIRLLSELDGENIWVCILNTSFISQYLRSPTISLDEPILTDEVHTTMNDTRSRDVTNKRRHR